MYSYHPNAICSIKARYSYTAKDSIHIPSPTWIGGQDGDLELSLECVERVFDAVLTFFVCFFLFLFFPSLMRNAK